MSSRLILLVLILAGPCLFSQNLRYYKIGQAVTSTVNACLLIKKGQSNGFNEAQLKSLKLFRSVKITGFNELNGELDSLLELISVHLQPKLLILENSDLSGLESRVSFKTLEKIQLLNCDFFETDLFHYFKGCPVQTLSIRSSDPEIATDSIYLLPEFKRLELSTTRNFSAPVRTETIWQQRGPVRGSYEVVYYGNNFRKKAEVGGEKERENESGKENESEVAYVKPQIPTMDCVRQPIPGININDTLFYVDSQAPISFTYESGSVLTFDKDAFTKEDGSDYVGKVQLFYREFRNPVEIMLSGIPMTNTEAGKTSVFKSGGMYEIRAFDTKGNPLKSKSDSSVKINMALTDTASDFKFYSLNNNGTWTTKDSTVKVRPAIKTSSVATRAVKEYYDFFYGSRTQNPDTTDYESRFNDKTYLYHYRKDNLYKNKDSVYSASGKDKGFFRVKYLTRTKDKDIVFTIVPASNVAFYEIPGYIQAFLGKKFIYAGDMNVEDFKKTFNRKIRYWDMRVNQGGSSCEFTFKTPKGFMYLTGTMISMKGKNYVVSANEARATARMYTRSLRRDAARFDRKPKNSPYGTRFSPAEFNCTNFGWATRTEVTAFAYCKKWQNPEEGKMDLATWKMYLRNFPDGYVNTFQMDNDLDRAMVKSGMGVKNIDAYIHAGQMEPFFVRYDVKRDTLPDEYNAVLYKTINTTYPLATVDADGRMQSYYFRKKPNYLIRFSPSGYMQVTKPEELAAKKGKGDKVELSYQQQYFVKNLNSDEITQLIFQ